MEDKKITTNFGHKRLLFFKAEKEKQDNNLIFNSTVGKPARHLIIRSTN